MNVKETFGGASVLKNVFDRSVRRAEGVLTQNGGIQSAGFMQILAGKASTSDQVSSGADDRKYHSLVEWKAANNMKHCQQAGQDYGMMAESELGAVAGGCDDRERYDEMVDCFYPGQEDTGIISDLNLGEMDI